MPNDRTDATEPLPSSNTDGLDEIPVAPEKLPSDDDLEIISGMAKLELLRQMEDIERLRE